MITITHPLLDANYLEEIYGGDQSILQIMFETFLEDSLTTWEEIAIAIESEDFQKVAALAHQIKPSFSMVGFTHFHPKIKVFEELSKMNPSKQILLANYLRLDVEVKEAKEVLEIVLSKLE
jgi:HPt (histidine-containing phosphotransfer) domain-containing protein